MQARTVTELGLLIRDRRREMQMNQADLARRVGVSRQWIVAVEKGKPGVALGLVLKTLGALGLQLHLGPQPSSAPRSRGEFHDPPIDLDALLSRMARAKPGKSR